MKKLERWIFAYGSIIWKPNFKYVDMRLAWLEGWQRYFWQSSTDHRGLPHAPGRVVTLVPHPQGRALGVAYKVCETEWDEILRLLDHREKGGYERRLENVEFEGEGESVQALFYVAAPDNPNYGGPRSAAEVAQIIFTASGPSGSNIEYFMHLYAFLQKHDAIDDHMLEIKNEIDLLKAPRRLG